MAGIKVMNQMNQYKVYECHGGYLLVVTRAKRNDWYVYTLTQRMTMLAFIDQLMGEEVLPEEDTP